MISAQQLMGYLQASCQDILVRSTLGIETKPLRKTQFQALKAYDNFLKRSDLSAEEKLVGFFEVPTGVGKTALFGSIIDSALEKAEADGVRLRVGIISPTVNLLVQTRDELSSLSPRLAQNIGIYGGNERINTKPITIITYNSWSNLSENGTLSKSDFELLISDEAHRGTSVARQKRLADDYNGIGMLAFTATAHFDPQKTVVNTHINKIFEKHISESVRDGELASYIQTQFYILRVEPDKAANDKSEEHRLIRQVAFNIFAEKLLLTGTDTYTGDRLTDNQGAIFVASTSQADLLAAKLNANATLRKIARARGCEAFAVAIHTNELNSAEQQRRERDYKAGKYLFIIGDEKFKEGFDHPPMKTVLDIPHGSLVDKAQILGRGARQWFNQQKNRSEGMIFADTVIYIGSDDPKLDKKLRDEALARAVLASDVLDGQALVVGPGASRPISIGPSGTTSHPTQWGDGITVTVFDTLESIRVLHSERDHARSGELVIQDWRRSEEYYALTELRRRKGGIGSRSILRLAEGQPATKGIFVAEHLIDYIIQGQSEKVEIRHVRALTELLSKQPDVSLRPVITPWPTSPEFKALTELRQRKKPIGTINLFKLCEAQESTRGIFSGPTSINDILVGKRKAVEVRCIQMLTDIFSLQPDAVSRSVIENWPQSSEYESLVKLRQRKGGIGGIKLYGLAQADTNLRDIFPSSDWIRLLIYGKIMKPDVRQVRAVKDLLESQPDVAPSATIKNWSRSSEYKALTDLRRRKGGIGSRILYQLAEGNEETQGIFSSEGVIRTNLSGRNQTVEVRQERAITKLLSEFPDRDLEGDNKITSSEMFTPVRTPSPSARKASPTRPNSNRRARGKRPSAN